MPADRTDNKTELLANWSKWFITLNFLSGTGCIIALKTAGESASKTGAIFFIAILFFGLSVISAVLFVFLLANQAVETQTGELKHLWLAKLQFIFFVAALIFVMIWIGFLSKVF